MTDADPAEKQTVFGVLAESNQNVANTPKFMFTGVIIRRNRVANSSTAD